MQVKLKRPIEIDKQKIESVNLDGLDALTGADVIFCRREAARANGGPLVYGVLEDMYRLEVAAKVSGLSTATLQKLHAVDFEEVDQAVRLFLIGADSEQPHTTPSEKSAPAA